MQKVHLQEVAIANAEAKQASIMAEEKEAMKEVKHWETTASVNKEIIQNKEEKIQQNSQKDQVVKNTLKMLTAKKASNLLAKSQPVVEEKTLDEMERDETNKALSSMKTFEDKNVVDKKTDDVVAKALARAKDKEARKSHPLSGNLFANHHAESATESKTSEVV